MKISGILKEHIIELGIEGLIVKSRFKELLHRVEKESDNVIKDYSKLGLSKTKRIISILSYDELLDLENIRECLGLSTNSEIANPKGYRLLEKAGIFEKDAGILIKNFKNLASILELKREDLIPFFEEEKVNEIFEKISHIKD